MLTTDVTHLFFTNHSAYRAIETRLKRSNNRTRNKRLQPSGCWQFDRLAHLLAVGPVHEDHLQLGHDEQGHREQDGQDQGQGAQQNRLRRKRIT